MSQDKRVTHNDFQELKEKVDWVEIHGAAAVTRKTMWCPYSYGKQQVSAVTFPDWFLEMAKRWLSCLNLNDEDKDALFPNSVNLNLYEHGDHQVAWHSDDEPLFRGKRFVKELKQDQKHQRAHAAMAVWQLSVMETKKDQAYAQLTETNAIAFQLQEACQVYTEDWELGSIQMRIQRMRRSKTKQTFL
eukprot:Skav229548  [mRNA]  locus=scaffold568:265840:271100:+ [translate_table: standard]